MNPAVDRARRRTAGEVLRRIDGDMAARLHHCAEGGDGVAGGQLHRLDREWDTDRTIVAEAASVGLVGLALGVWVQPRWLLLPALAGAGLLVHATTGRYPLMPLLRRLGVRTAREIERERYAVKALRGDFALVPDAASQPADRGASPAASRRADE